MEIQIFATTNQERKENLKRLRVENQRLLRETRDAKFNPIPMVQKPISSILDKIWCLINEQGKNYKYPYKVSVHHFFLS
ncbi:hypothetical protein RIF29_35770 [Crotalaria pallida]|uniref:Uncharacterized protein n=1 Tax=Crotalaria pallida TaxID=3830 RepID=A0AAN9ECJ7_CROPI